MHQSSLIPIKSSGHMGRAPCCAKVGLRKGAWTTQEDDLLTKYIIEHGEGQWRNLPQKAGLSRCGKSCRLRWRNYLKPGIRRGNITLDEEDLIIRMHKLLGNRWSLIAIRLGRTDNEIKNHWNTHICKKLKSQGMDPTSQRKTCESIKLKKISNKYIKNSSNDSDNQQKTVRNVVPGEQKSIPVEHLFKIGDNHCSESNPESIIGSCSQEIEGGPGYCTEAAEDFGWPSLEGGYIDSVACFLSGDNEVHINDIVGSSKLESESFVLNTDLEKLKEEFSKILKGENQ